MKKKKKIIIIIFIILIFLLYILNSVKYSFLQEDLIFFQLFSSINKSENQAKNEQESNILLSSTKSNKKTTVNKESSSIVQIGFDVRYGDTKLKDLELSETINTKTLVYEKIAPGTSGNFDIVLKSKEETNYKISFESENVKPTNLQFYTSENDKRYNSLEELGKDLSGKLLKDDEKNITVNWEWCYEINEKNNKKDTTEAKKIREYNFIIYVQGY